MLPLAIGQPPWSSVSVRAAPSEVKAREPEMRSGSPGYHVSTAAREPESVPRRRKTQLNDGAPPGPASPRPSAKTPATVPPFTARVRAP